MNHPDVLRRMSLCLMAAGLVCLATGTTTSCVSRSAPTPPNAPTESVPVAELLAQAERLYAQREDLARVRESVSLLRRVRVANFNNYEVTWRLAKFNYYLGDHTTDTNERDAAFRAGIEAGQAAIAAEPKRPEGHFWLGANLGGQAKAQGPLRGLAAVADIRREMEAVLKLDEGYQGGSAYMVLGQVELEMPVMLGGDRKKAVELLEKGLRYGEGNSLLRLRLAEAYISVRRHEDARKQLKAILNMTPDPDYLPEYRAVVAEARQLLEKRL
jgi:tetratricopeptide (TPR) repeat protein